MNSQQKAENLRLPSERDLAARYGTARNTAREAVRLLAEAGLVSTGQGEGSFIRPSAPLIRLGNDRYSPRHRETGFSPFLLECAMPHPGENRLLRLRPGVPVTDVWLTSVGQDGEPCELTRFVMPGDMAGLVYDVPVE